MGAVRITYITHTRFPTEKAHGHQVAQVCGALASLGHTVTLVTPTVGSSTTKDPWKYYDVPKIFEIRRLTQFDALNSRIVPGILAFAVSMWSYRRALKRYLQNNPADLLYVRSAAVLETALQTGRPVIMEIHTIPRLALKTFVGRLNRCVAVVCLTGLQRDALLKCGVSEEKIVVEPDGVSLERFQNIEESSSAKEHWGLPCDVPIVGYVGSLATGHGLSKGLDELLSAFAMLQGNSFLGWIVGGPAGEVHRLQRKAAALHLKDTMRFQSRIGASDVPSAICACDICVYPAPASSDPFFRRDTSPLKLLEYLAAGKPVVCADLPPIRDIVDEKAVVFCNPGDPKSLAAAIAAVITDPVTAHAKAEHGRAIAAKHDWKKRMERILKPAISPSSNIAGHPRSSFPPR